MAFFIIILMATSGQQCMSYASYAISVSNVTAGMKTRSVFQDRD